MQPDLGPSYLVTGAIPKVRHIADPKDVADGPQTLCNLFRYRAATRAMLRQPSGRRETVVPLCGGCLKSLRSEKYLAA